MFIRLRIDRTVLLALACVAAVTAARADERRMVHKVYAVADLVVPVKDCDAPTPPTPAAKCATQAALTCSVNPVGGLRFGIGFDVKCGSEACEQPCPAAASCCVKATAKCDGPKCCAGSPPCKDAAKCCDKTAMPACCPNGPCCPDGPCCPKGLAKSEPQPTTHDRLIKLVTSTVTPACWTDAGGRCTINFYPVGMAMVVSAPPDVHEQVEGLLESLRRTQDTEVAFEVKVVAVADERYHDCFDAPARAGFDRGAPTFLDDHQRAALFQAMQGDRRTCVLQAPKLTVFNGQRAAIRCTQEQMFVTSMDSMSVNGQTHYVPKNETFTCGFQMSVRPTVSADRRFVRCEVKAEHSDLAEPPPLHPFTYFITPVFEGGAHGQPIPLTQFVQQPQVVRCGVEKSLMIPDGGTAVLYAGKRTKTEECGGDCECAPVCDLIYAIVDLFATPTPKPTVTEHMVVLVTPRVIVKEQAEAAVARPMPCGPAIAPLDPHMFMDLGFPIRQCATPEVAPQPRCCPSPCQAPAPMPMTAPGPQVQLDMCVLSLDPTFWDRPDAAAWADLSARACDGKPKMLSAGEARRFCQSMRSMNVGKMLAEPRMITLSGQEATFLSGGEQMRLTSMTMADGVDGAARPVLESSKSLFRIHMTMLPLLHGDRIHLDCNCSCSQPGKEYRRTIEVPGMEPWVQTYSPKAEVWQAQFKADVPCGGSALLFHCGKDTNGRDVIVTVAPAVTERPPVAAYPAPPACGMFAPCPQAIMPTAWTAPMPMPPIPVAEPPCDPKLMKLMDKYYQACAHGDTAKARKFAEKCMAIDPTCFGK